jgi:hypothetical protein
VAESFATIQHGVGSVCNLLHAGSGLCLLFHPEDGGDLFRRNIYLTLSGLYDVAAEKTELVTTAVTVLHSKCSQDSDILTETAVHYQMVEFPSNSGNPLYGEYAYDIL